MAQDGHEMLELLKFELKFVEDGGCGRSPRTPWRPPYILEDSGVVRTWAIRRGPIPATMSIDKVRSQ
jgi:hypothetical protein